MIIDGKSLASSIKERQALLAKQLMERGVTPSLTVILVGEDEASKIYVRNKEKACAVCNIKSNTMLMPYETTTEELQEVIKVLVNDKNCNGILVQLPLPKHIDEKACLSLIPDEKDVDGFSKGNTGKLWLGEECIAPCTPSGIIEMIKSVTEIEGKNAVVLGRSNIVGKPVAALLLRENATVTICHSKTSNLKEICKNADILVVAIGKPKFVTADMVKNGATVIDVGINRVDGKVVGDVDFENVAKVAENISPVPGGVGPMTIAKLMENTLIATKRQNKIG